MNSDNLKPIRTHEEAVRLGKLAGKASGEARRRKADLRRCLQILLEEDVKDKNGRYIQRDGQNLSGAEALSAKLFQMAMKGDVRAFEVLRDTAGQKPADKVLTAHVDPEVMDEVERMVHGTDKD